MIYCFEGLNYVIHNNHHKRLGCFIFTIICDAKKLPLVVWNMFINQNREAFIVLRFKQEFSKGAYVNFVYLVRS